MSKGTLEESRWVSIPFHWFSLPTIWSFKCLICCSQCVAVLYKNQQVYDLRKVLLINGFRLSTYAELLLKIVSKRWASVPKVQQSNSRLILFLFSKVFCVEISLYFFFSWCLTTNFLVPLIYNVSFYHLCTFNNYKCEFFISTLPISANLHLRNNLFNKF